MRKTKPFLRGMLIACILCLSPTIGAQNVSIKFQNATLSTVLKEIAHQANYELAYSESSVNLSQKVSITQSDTPLEEVLTAVLRNTNLDFSVKNGKIFLMSKNLPESQKQGALINISGTVTDAKGESLIGVNVTIKGLSNGAITDIDGKYTIDAPINSTLVFSYIGYISKSEEVKGRKSINIVLSEDTKNLEEVVVIGYGAIRKSDLTGAVASVKTDELNHTTSTLEQALIGHTPGVEIKQTSGAPGSGTTIRIRGVNSVYGGVEPLYVIDGYPASKDVYINPSDVASIEVLKDAASAAIYGSRASGGVVLITTKRGSRNAPKVELEYQFSLQQLSRKINMMNAEEQRELHQDGYNNAYFDYLRTNNLYATTEECWQHSRSDDEATRFAMGAGNSMLLCPDIMAGNYDTDWQDALYSNAPMHRTNISVSGGKDGAKYMFSLGYLNQEGIISPGYHNRITSRLNMDFDVTPRFSIGVNSSMYYVKERTIRTDGLAFNDGVILNALGMPPAYPVYNENGSYATGWAYKNTVPYTTFAGENAVALANERKEYYTRSRYALNADFRYKIIDGLQAKLNVGMQIADQIYNLYRPGSTLGGANNAVGDFSNTLVRAVDNRDFNTDWLLEATLNYNKTFGKHGINAVAGYSMQKKVYNNIDANSVTGALKDDRITELSAATATDTDENGTIASTNKAAWALMSYFGRAMYNYDSRYTLSGTLRTDGCSRFGSANRWGLFPSISAGWNISNEEFFAPAADFMTAKLRASWGISGNNNISNYRHIATISSGTYNFGTSTVTTYYPSGFTDQELGWERTNQTNVGLDMSFFNGRINVIANYYYSVTKDLLYQATVSAISGSTSYWTNLKDGKVYNQGGDIQVDGSIIATKDFRWNMGFNVSINRNKVKGLSDEITSIGQRKQITHITRNGLPIGSFYGMVSEGLITEDDYANILIDKQHQGEDGYQLVGPAVADYTNVYIGDVKWKDVNGDGTITTDDRDVIGNNYPDFTFGINTTFSWKGLSLSATFDGQYGAEVINFSRYYICNNEGGCNSLSVANNRYRDETTVVDKNTMYRANRVAKNLNTQFSTYFVEDASFFRCTNMTLGYSIPKNRFFDKVNVSNLHVYASVDNLFMLTDYTGYNPDVDYNSGNLTPGIDFGTYPLSRAWSVGLKLTF